MTAKRVGILTGGGDVPGLNATIKSAVARLIDAGREVVGIRRGWAGLLHLDPARGLDDPEWLRPLDRIATRAIDREGGTFLHTSRTNPALLARERVPERLRSQLASIPGDGPVDFTDEAVRNVEALGLEALIAIGGDGTLSFARRLDQEGVAVVGVPKTMDNDVAGTDYCIGFSTAVTRAVALVNSLRTVAGSHERILVVEVFGRRSGEPCWMAAHLAGADRAVVAEVPFDPAAVAQLAARDRRENPSRYAVVLVSEGARAVGGEPFTRGRIDPAGNPRLGGVGEFLAREIERREGVRTLDQSLAYLLRAGVPDAFDLLVAKSFGQLAAELVLAGETGRLVAVEGGRYTAVPLARLGDTRPGLDVERFYDRAAYRPRIERLLDLPVFLHGF
jgi:6-phosphofructokinase 1